MAKLTLTKETAAKRSGVKFRVKTQDYIGNNGNFWFEPAEMRSTSYGWYDLLRVINGKLVMNACKYSNQTAKHVSKLMDLLSFHGMQVDIYIYAPKGLNNLPAARDWYMGQIGTLRVQMATPGTRKAKNAERAEQINAYIAKVKLIERMIKAETKAKSKTRSAMRVCA